MVQLFNYFRYNHIPIFEELKIVIYTAIYFSFTHDIITLFTG